MTAEEKAKKQELEFDDQWIRVLILLEMVAEKLKKYKLRKNKHWEITVTKTEVKRVLKQLRKESVQLEKLL